MIQKGGFGFVLVGTLALGSALAQQVDRSRHAYGHAEVARRSQTLTLREPEHTMDLRVPDSAPLELAKAGGQIVATFIGAMTVSAEAAAPAAPAKKRDD
jgi:hypothetical protein